MSTRAAMRTLIFAAFFAVPAVGQTPPPLPILDFTNGTGSGAPAAFGLLAGYKRPVQRTGTAWTVQGGTFVSSPTTYTDWVPEPLTWAQLSTANWYMQVADEWGGTITYTYPDGRTSDAPLPLMGPVTVTYRIYPLNFTATAAGITFNGFAGGPIMTGAPPAPGMPYQLPPGTPGTAVWKNPVRRPAWITPYQLFTTFNAMPGPSMGFWTPQVGP